MPEQLIVHCDNCGWESEIEWDTFMEYVDDICPICEHKLLNEYDIAVWNQVDALRKEGLLEPLEDAECLFKLEINTAPDGQLFTVMEVNDGNDNDYN